MVNDETHRGLYIPKGVAHGFQSLADDSEVLYLIAPAFQAEASRGVRFNDPSFGITWPLPRTFSNSAANSACTADSRCAIEPSKRLGSVSTETAAAPAARTRSR